VEEVFRSLPGVEDCLVFGVPDARFGERVCAIVQSRGGKNLEHAHLIGLARHDLAGYKVPRALVTHEVPRFPNGKPDYATAKELTAQALFRA
jgi:acyl-CoA synthetase (AMP-forming)/AMP-acid ligase II